MDEHPGNDQGQTAERKTRSKDAWWKGTEANRGEAEEAKDRGAYQRKKGPLLWTMLLYNGW